MLVSLLIPLTVMYPRVLPPAKRALWDPTAFKDLPYAIFTLSVLIGFMGLYVPFFYIQYYSEAKNITHGQLSFYLLAILNAGSVFGRITPNFLAQRTGPLNMLVPCVLITAICTFSLISVHNVGGVIVFCLCFGFFSGTFVSLPPTVFIALTRNRALIGTRLGMGFAIASLGALAGTPIAGAILKGSGFTATWCFSGALVIGAGILMIVARLLEKSDIMARV